MNSKQLKNTDMQLQLQQLRSVTNSSMNELQLFYGYAIKYIKELTKKVEELKKKVDGLLNLELGISESSISHDKLPMVTVETLEKGFQICVVSKRNYPGMLVAILEATEELGHDVLDARISCEDTFELEAFVGERQDNESIDPQLVKQAVVQAINKMD